MGSACDEQSSEDLLEALGISKNSAVYEFTKAFAKTAVTKYENLGKKKGRVRRMGKLGGELVALGVFSGSSRSSPHANAIRRITALGLQSVAGYVDKLMQAKTKISIISIINAESSKSFDETFLLCFIVFALHTYNQYKHSLEYINLEAPGEKTNRENKLQAIQMLAEYAGAVCFSALLKCETRDENEFLKKLDKKNFKKDFKSQWNAATLVNLYYWAHEVGETDKKFKKVITPYEFFLKTEFHVFHEKDCSTIHFCKDSKQNSWAEFLKLKKPEKLEPNQQGLIPAKSYFEEDGQKLDFSWAPINFDINIEKYARTLYSCIVRDESFSRDVTGTNLVKDLHAKVDEQNSKLNEILEQLEEDKCVTVSRDSLRFQIQKPMQNFTGRLDCLADLHQKLTECTADRTRSGGSRTQAPLLILAAPAGMGKTEVVRMYIQKYGHEYNHIVWIDAANHSSAQAQFRVKLAAELRVRTELRGRPKPFEALVKEIYQNMCQNDKREIRSALIIFDNADSLSDGSESPIKGIQAYLPPPSCQDDYLKPTILVTSRSKKWDYPDTTILLCYPWTESECVSLCLEQTKLPSTADNRKAAAKLGNIFNFNPFTLQAATAVILNRQKNLAGKSYGIRDFIENYEKCGSEIVLKTPPIDISPGTGLQNLTIIDLWGSTFQKIHKLKNGEIAIKIICFAAYLSTFSFTHSILSVLLPKVEHDDFEQALNILENYFVIEHSNNKLAIHPIIRDIAKVTLKSEAKQRNLLFQETFLNHATLLVELLTGLVQYLESSLKLGEISANEQHHLTDNIFALTSHLTELDLMHTKELEKAVYLLDLFCSISKSYALEMDYNKIIDLYGALLKGTNSQRGPEHTRLLTLKRKIGDVLMKQEKYADAKEIYTKVFTAYKKLLGRDHEDTLTTQACIADALICLGDYAGALKMFIEILIKQKERMDLACDQVELTLKFKVATLLCEHGEYADALKLLERVLKDSKEMYGHGPGADNLFQLQVQTWIARVLVKQEKYDEAVELYIKLMDTSKNIRGPYHTNTLLLKCDYATALSCKGRDHETAKDILQSTLKYQNQTKAYTMLELAETENNLAHVLVNLNDTKSANEMYAHVLQVRSAHLGPEHPLTLSTEHAWAYALYCEQKFHKAGYVFRKVLSGQKIALGKYHPDTILTIQYLSQSLFEQGEDRMSVRFAAYLHELKIRRNFLIADHPKLIRNQQLLDLCIARLPKSVQGVSKFPKPTPPPLLNLPSWIFVEAGNISNISACNPSVRGPDNGNLDGKLLCCCTYRNWTKTIAAMQIIICGLSFILNIFDLLPHVPTAYFILSLLSGSLLTVPENNILSMMLSYDEFPPNFEGFDQDVHQIFMYLDESSPYEFSSLRLTLAAYSFICAVAGSILFAGAYYVPADVQYLQKKQALLLFWMLLKGLEIGIFGITLMYLVNPIFKGNVLACVVFSIVLVCEAQKVVFFYIVSRHRREFNDHLARVREELLPVEFGFVNIA